MCHTPCTGWVGAGILAQAEPRVSPQGQLSPHRVRAGGGNSLFCCPALIWAPAVVPWYRTAALGGGRVRPHRVTEISRAWLSWSGGVEPPPNIRHMGRGQHRARGTWVWHMVSSGHGVGGPALRELTAGKGHPVPQVQAGVGPWLRVPPQAGAGHTAPQSHPAALQPLPKPSLASATLQLAKH